MVRANLKRFRLAWSSALIASAMVVAGCTTAPTVSKFQSFSPIPLAPWNYESYVLFTDPCYASVTSEAVKTFGELPLDVARTWLGLYRASLSRGDITVLFSRTAAGFDCAKIGVLTLIPAKYRSPLTLKLPDFKGRTITIYPSILDRSALMKVTEKSGRSLLKKLVLRPSGFEVDYGQDMLVIVARGSTQSVVDFQTSVQLGDTTTYFVTFAPRMALAGPFSNP